MPKVKPISLFDRIKVEDVHYPADIRKYVMQIKDTVHNLKDDEAATAMERSLHERVLEVIASTPPHIAHVAPALAAEALKTKKIKFERYAS